MRNPALTAVGRQVLKTTVFFLGHLFGAMVVNSNLEKVKMHHSVASSKSTLGCSYLHTLHRSRLTWEGGARIT